MQSCMLPGLKTALGALACTLLLGVSHKVSLPCSCRHARLQVSRQRWELCAVCTLLHGVSQEVSLPCSCSCCK